MKSAALSSMALILYPEYHILRSGLLLDDLIFATLTSPGNGQEPSEFLIPADRMLGYRPVHRKLIGVAWQGPLDPFWSLVYRICGVTGGHDFSMVTHCGEKVRPYFDAGIIVVRPEHGLLTVRHRVFREAHLRSDFQEFYRENRLYAIFIHQGACRQSHTGRPG